MKVSIILPVYHIRKDLLDNIKGYLSNISKNFETLVIDGKNGLANAYNTGIRKAKGEIIITLHQDCIPLEEDSIQKLVEPFKDEEVVLTYSKIKDICSNKEYIPFISDGKFTAFRKSSLEEVGLFDEKTFFTGGEDVDMWMKLKKIGKIILVDTLVLHNHDKYLGNKTIEKRKQNGNINGVLFRRYLFRFPIWYKALISCFIYPTTYGKEFVKSFVINKQNYRRKE